MSVGPDETDELPAKKSVRPPVVDPFNVPTNVVNVVMPTAYFGSLLSLTLGMSRAVYETDGTARGEMVVVARLRFDLEMAKLLRDVLSQQIEALTPPEDAKRN